MKHLLLILMLAITITSCGSEEEGDILTYIENNNLTGFVETPEGVFYKIDDAGDETMKPKIGEITVVHYKGYYTDGEEFDNSYKRGQPFTTELVSVIGGWRVGLPYFGEGGSGTIIIPPSLGYGDNPPSGIRENAILIFDVDILEVQ